MSTGGIINCKKLQEGGDTKKDVYLQIQDPELHLEDQGSDVTSPFLAFCDEISRKNQIKNGKL